MLQYIATERPGTWSIELVYRRRPVGGAVVPEIIDFQKLLEEKQREKVKRSENKNKGGSDPNDLQGGDLVLIRNRNRNKDSKLDTCFVGPFIVVEWIGFGGYEVRSVESGKISKVTRGDMEEFDDKREFVCLLGCDWQIVDESKAGGMSRRGCRLAIAAPDMLSAEVNK